jgi:hypothetical protein
VEFGVTCVGLRPILWKSGIILDQARLGFGRLFQILWHQNPLTREAGESRLSYLLVALLFHNHR